jgi:hypothetical protein
MFIKEQTSDTKIKRQEQPRKYLSFPSLKVKVQGEKSRRQKDSKRKHQGYISEIIYKLQSKMAAIFKLH